MKDTRHLLVVQENEGPSLSIAGGRYRIVVSGAQTAGEFAIIEMTVPPGAGPMPHAHPDFDESFFVLEGEVNFESEEGKCVAGKGTYVHIPKGGMVHCFKNFGSQEAKLLCTVFPAGLDACFTEAADYFTAHGDAPEAEKKARMMEIMQKYGNTLYPPDYFQG